MRRQAHIDTALRKINYFHSRMCKPDRHRLCPACLWTGL